MLGFVCPRSLPTKVLLDIIKFLRGIKYRFWFYPQLRCAPGLLANQLK